jgi:hypothetical protein
MNKKPILFCSSKAVPHMALLAHLYDLPYEFRRKNKPVILRNAADQFIASTHFTEHIHIDHPINGHLPEKTSELFADFIIGKSKEKFNLVNYSELLNDYDFNRLQDFYDIIQLIIEPEYRKSLILNRLFRLYDLEQKNYVIVDQGLNDHKDTINKKSRLKTYMQATNWKDEKDVNGFINFLLSDDSPIYKSLNFEDVVKQKRPSIKLSYHNLFHNIDDYFKLCDIIGKKPAEDQWKSIISSCQLPQHIYYYGQFWDIAKI